MTLTPTEVRALPAVIDLPTAAAVLDIGRTVAYELARSGRFPTPVIRVGNQLKVPTAYLLELGRQLGANCPLLGRKGHGSWWFRYDAPRSVAGGGQQLRVGPFASRREAEAALAETLDRVNKGVHVDTDRSLTFARYLDEWLEGKVALKSTTRLSYVHHITLYLRPGLGHIKLSELRDTDFQELYAAMRQIGRPRTERPSPMLSRLLAVRTDTHRHADRSSRPAFAASTRPR